MTKLSIIVPVYNVAQYIERCLASIEQQTLRDMEVILVDDHGSDNSMALAKDYTTGSSRNDILYRFAETPQNCGPAKARNIGLQMAQGEYVAFLDADDWVEPDMYRTLFESAKAQKADLSCCNAMQDFDNGRDSRLLKNPVIEKNPLTPFARKKFLLTYVAYFWTFIYRREWLIQHQIVFADAKNGEDSAFLATCILMAQTIVTSPAALYHYVMHEGSLVSKPRTWRIKEKKKAYKTLFSYAYTNQVLFPYLGTLVFLYIKKVGGMLIK